MVPTAIISFNWLFLDIQCLIHTCIFKHFFKFFYIWMFYKLHFQSNPKCSFTDKFSPTSLRFFLTIFHLTKLGKSVSIFWIEVINFYLFSMLWTSSAVKLAAHLLQDHKACESDASLLVTKESVRLQTLRN